MKKGKAGKKEMPAMKKTIETIVVKLCNRERADQITRELSKRGNQGWVLLYSNDGGQVLCQEYENGQKTAEQKFPPPDGVISTVLSKPGKTTIRYGFEYPCYVQLICDDPAYSSSENVRTFPSITPGTRETLFAVLRGCIITVEGYWTHGTLLLQDLPLARIAAQEISLPQNNGEAIISYAREEFVVEKYINGALVETEKGKRIVRESNDITVSFPVTPSPVTDTGGGQT